MPVKLSTRMVRVMEWAGVEYEVRKFTWLLDLTLNFLVKAPTRAHGQLLQDIRAKSRSLVDWAVQEWGSAQHRSADKQD